MTYRSRSSRGPCPAKTYSRIAPQATPSVRAAPVPGRSAPGPSAIAFSALAAAAAAVSRRAYTPTCRRRYRGSRSRRAPEPGSCHLRAHPLCKATLRGRLGAARRYDVTDAASQRLQYTCSGRAGAKPSPPNHGSTRPDYQRRRREDAVRGALVTG